eukprot:scaffold51592_cov18-Prasinocladus_malaysianus.AAC.1
MLIAHVSLGRTSQGHSGTGACLRCAQSFLDHLMCQCKCGAAIVSFKKSPKLEQGKLRHIATTSEDSTSSGANIQHMRPNLIHALLTEEISSQKLARSFQKQIRNLVKLQKSSGVKYWHANKPRTATAASWMKQDNEDIRLS